MRSALAAVLLAGTMTPLPLTASAGQPSRGAPWNGLTALGPSTASHATRGTVKSVDERTLVIARFGHRGDITFALSPATHREGTIVVGAVVSVRYREDGQRHIATAVTVQRRDSDARQEDPR